MTNTTTCVSAAGTCQHMHNGGETRDNTTTPKPKATTARKVKSMMMYNVANVEAEDSTKATVADGKIKVTLSRNTNKDLPLMGVPQGTTEAEKRGDNEGADMDPTQDGDTDTVRSSPIDVKLVTADTHSPKHKPEADKDDNIFVPGQNQFTPLFETTSPFLKSTRSELLNDQVTETVEEEEMEELDKQAYPHTSSSGSQGCTYHRRAGTHQHLHLGPPALNLAMMVAPAPSTNPAPQSITIYCDQVGMNEPHTISPQHVFHNYCWEQINELQSSLDPNDILIIVWGLEFWNLTLTMEQQIENTLKAYFKIDNLGLQIAAPCLLTCSPSPLTTTGTPLPFYIHGLSEEQADILDVAMILTSLDSYIVLDPSNFIMDFVFTINGLNALSDIQGQHLVEKVLKDKLYTTPKVWSFLQSHHDAIDPSIPPEDVPFLVILSLEARSLWIKGQNSELGHQA
ncbi:hypothetical protein IW261DRAFT_1427711 [Armillaria novae-zelandiae]|uniref:Uncharacterized protein n=1 Tax=Armillaria novae-zelandiae TaxID=153914 RepID=A0AA39ND84_9AGAR|nr:hypothetical protein IW261DRAFT_1427711 [Armillaria novae-zelandiae]